MVRKFIFSSLLITSVASTNLLAHEKHVHQDHQVSHDLKASDNLKSGSTEHSHPNKLSNLIGMDDYFTLSGVIGFYGQTMDDNDANIDRDEFGSLYGSLHLETNEWQGFRLGLTGLAHGEAHDHNENYGEYYDQRSAILSEAFIKYNYENTEFTIGRQGVDWLMLGDYFEGLFVESEAFDHLLIRAAWVHKGGVFDPDEIVDYDELNDDDGIWGLEITYNGFEGLAVTGLYYHAPDAYDIFGGEIFYEHHCSEDLTSATLVQYFGTDEEESFADYPEGDGSIFHANHTMTYKNLSVGAGYIEADKKAGAGNMLNNPWDPFDEDSHTDRANAETWYVQGEYAFGDSLSVFTVYGESDTDEGNGDAKFKEFDLGLAYQVMDGLLIEVTYVHLSTTDDADEGFDKYWFHVSYEF